MKKITTYINYAAFICGLLCVGSLYMAAKFDVVCGFALFAANLVNIYVLRRLNQYLNELL